MRYKKIKYADINAEISLSMAYNQEHLIIRGENVEEALSRYKESSEKRVIFKRYYHSDLANQDHGEGSLVGQSLLDGTKIGMYAILSDDDSHKYYYNMKSWEELEEAMSKDGMSVAGNCVRTWLYVRDIDLNYKRYCEERKSFFRSIGLTEKTHYIASTGIESKNGGFSLDALGIKNVKKEQIQYLYAPTHLNPTYEYGVTFERGVKVDFGDYSEIYISGTASIDNQGNVLYKGDIVAQTNRMIENVGALLSEAGSSFDELAQMVIYLRDIADYERVKEILDEKFEEVPKLIVYGPVCRKEWLIEMECMGISCNK